MGRRNLRGTGVGELPYLFEGERKVKNREEGMG